MSKARKEAAKKKAVAQKAATKAKKLQTLVLEDEQSGSTPGPGVQEGDEPSPAELLDDVDLARELFERATFALKTATDKGEYSSVIDFLRQAIRLDPNQVDYFVSLAIAYSHAGQHDFALAASEMALQLAPDHPIAAENRRQAIRALRLPITTKLS
jgi:tetratricopeptide (TPR) repeat protein